jgi:phenylacetaldehyde dehydrogenase
MSQPAVITANSAQARWQGQLLIDGRWVNADSGALIEVFNPATGLKLGTVQAGGSVDVGRAVEAARRSFDDARWHRMAATERSKILFRVADLLETRSEELARIETQDNGMPLAMASGLVTRSADMFRYFGGWCTKIHGQTAELGAQNARMLGYTLREPIGVAGLIIPWNVPLVSASQKVAVALAAGCSVILKPAEEAPFSSLKLGEILCEAGVPDGVVNIVTGIGEVAGAALAAHAAVDKISFTGSIEVGRSIVHAAAGSNLKRVTLELGGKSPVVIFNDADLSQAIPGAARGIFRNSGQVCAAGSRLYVQRERYDEVVQGLAKTAAALRLGDGLEPTTEMGPLISARHRDRVLGLVRSGLDAGAELVTGSQVPDGPGYFMQPTILGRPMPGSAVLREEIFGPVLTVSPFETIDEVKALANNSSYGLAAAVWTKDVAQAHRMASALQAGMVWINCQSVADASMPFGGYKQSGWGREHGWEGVEAFLQTKSIFTPL